MKYLIVIAVLLVAWFVWRQQRVGRHKTPSAPPAAPRAAGDPQAMVRCPVCALHLPDSDAVAGRQGRYCSEAHRAQAEG